MPWTQTDIDTLKQAIADGRGVRQLTFADQSVQFHSIDEMLRLLAVMHREVNVATTQTRRYASFSKGA